MIYNKKYEYKCKIYCEDDLSEEFDNYGGDLYDLYLDLEEDSKAGEVSYYYNLDGDKYYDTIEELIEKEFDYLEVYE